MNAKQSHGGRRQGAGRKPALDHTERFELGEWCESLWQQGRERRAVAEYEDRPELAELRRLQQTAIEIHRRWAGHPLQGQSEKAENSRDIADWFKDHGVSRLVSIPLKRAKDERNRIISKVIAKFETIRGKKVSKRTVDSCWDEFRRALCRAKAS